MLVHYAYSLGKGLMQMYYWNRKPLALIPGRINTYDYTDIYGPRTVQRVYYSIYCVIRNLTKSCGFSAAQLRRGDARKKMQSLFLSDDCVLVPLKMQTGQFACGYLNAYEFRRLEINDERCFAVLRSGLRIPVLWSMMRTAAHLKDCDAIKRVDITINKK